MDSDYWNSCILSAFRVLSLGILIRWNEENGMLRFRTLKKKYYYNSSLYTLY